MCAIAKDVNGVEDIIFATGNLPENELMRPLVEAAGVRFLMGSEDNVLERFCEAVRPSRAEYIVRLTCDNYLIQPQFIEALAQSVETARADYGYIEPLSHYAGEVIRREVLLREFDRGDYSPLAREHVTYDIRGDQTVARKTLPADFGGVDHRQSLTLDSLDDLIQLKRLERKYPDLARLRCMETLQKISPIQP